MLLEVSTSVTSFFQKEKIVNKNLEFLLYLEQLSKEEKDISLERSILDFKEKHPRFNIINKDIILIHLYGSIVLPWEKLKKKLPKKIMMSEINHEEWGFYKILNHNPSHPIHKMDLRFFLRKLRNSISHNNVIVKENKSVIFRDRDGSKIQYEWTELLKLMNQLQ